MNHNHRSDLQSKVTHNHRSHYRQIVNDRSGVMATSNDEENAAGNPEVGFEQPRRRSLEKQVRRSLDERVSKWDWCVFTWSVLWLMLWIGCLPQPLAMTKSRKLLFIVKGNPALAYPFKSSIPPLTSPLKCGVTCTVSSGFLPHFQISYNGEKIDHEKSRYPNSIVWTPIPLLSWIFPFIGHMGIAMTNGKGGGWRETDHSGKELLLTVLSEYMAGRDENHLKMDGSYCHDLLLLLEPEIWRKDVFWELRCCWKLPLVRPTILLI